MRKPKIVLIHSPHPEAIEDRLDAPLGLLLIAGMLLKNGFEVEINDLQGAFPDVGWEISEGDLYGITVYATSLRVLDGITRKCKERNKSCKIIVGGAHPTSAPYSLNSFLLQGKVDSVVLGEGELAMLKAAHDYPDLRGYYKEPLGKDLDMYHFPAYHLVDLSSYRRTINGKKSVTVLASRGCPFNCAFCALPPQNRTVKKRSPDEVAREIKMLREKYSIEALNFQDDCFTLDKEQLYRLFALLSPLGIVFRCHGRAGADTLEDYRRMREAGCVQVAWGIESGSQRMLNRMRKGVKVKDNEDVIRWAKEVGIVTRAFFIFGFPGENEETIEETKRFIERADPDQYFVSSFVPYPGTDVWDTPDVYGIVKIDDDFSKFYQVDKTGYGGVSFETFDLSPAKFLELEKDFRGWISKRKRRGPLLDYEKKMEDGSA